MSKSWSRKQPAEKVHLIQNSTSCLVSINPHYGFKYNLLQEVHIILYHMEVKYCGRQVSCNSNHLILVILISFIVGFENIFFQIDSSQNLAACHRPNLIFQGFLIFFFFQHKPLSSTVKHNSPPHVKRFCRSTRCSGHEHLGVPSPLAMQMCEHPPLSREHGCAAGKAHRKND